MTQIPAVRDRATFDALSRARRYSRGLVTMRYVPSRDTPRVSITTGRGTGNAVTRNRVRRRLRAAVAAHRDELRPGAYLFGSGRQAAEAPFGALRDAVGELLRAVPETSP